MVFSRNALTSSALFVLWLTAPFITASLGFASTSIYTYTDDAGVQTFTNDFDSIPEKYRHQLTKREFEAPATAPLPAATEPPARSADVRTVTAGGEYRMGDHDTRTDAVRLAVEAAKKDALEQVATYLESITEVRNLEVTRDDIRSYTAGIVKVLDERITTRLEDETVVIRADLTAEIDPHEVAQAIAALRENESARNELMALRAETDQLQQQLEAANRALALAASPDEVQQLTQQRDDLLNQIQANAFVSQAWTSWTYPTLGFSSYPWIGIGGVNGLLVQAQRLYPRHRHLPLAQQTMTAMPGTPPAVPPGTAPPPPRHSLLVPSAPHVPTHHAPPVLNTQGQTAKVGDVVVMPTPRSVPPTPQYRPQPPPYQLHPNHFWRPSPPNIPTAPPIPPQISSVPPQHYGGHGGRAGGGGGGSRSGGSRSGGGGRGR